MRENYLFVLVYIGCFLIGQITTNKQFSFESPKLPIIVLKTSFILDVIYLVILTICISRVKVMVKDVFKLIILVVVSIAVMMFLPAHALVLYYGRTAVVGISMVWMLLQSVHMLDNIQIFHNYLLFNLLNIKPWQEEQKRTALRWLYVHMSLSVAGMCFIVWLCSCLDKILTSSAAYSIDCITHNYVDSMYHSVVVISVLLMLLSLPRFTNKGLLMPVLLFIYQLYLCCVTMLIKISTCVVAPPDTDVGIGIGRVSPISVNADHSVDSRSSSSSDNGITWFHQDAAHPDESPQARSQHFKNVQFLQYTCVCFSTVFLCILLFYNMSAPNMKSLHNIVRGHLFSHHTTDNSFIVKRSWLFRATAEEGPPLGDESTSASVVDGALPLSERAPLMSGQGQGQGQSSSGGGSNDSVSYGTQTSANNTNTSSNTTSNTIRRDVDLNLLTRVPVLSPADTRTAPVPLYYVYFMLISGYLPMYLTNWYGLGAYHVNNTYFGGNTNPAYFYHVDYVSYCIISIQVLLWVIYMISLFSAYSDMYGFVL